MDKKQSISDLCKVLRIDEQEEYTEMELVYKIARILSYLSEK